MIDQVFRDDWGRVLAVLIGILGDFDLAEDSLQDAFAIAVERWGERGVPANPSAWLLTTARHRAIDRLRRERLGAAKARLLEPLPSVAEEPEAATGIPDERLQLIFMCCHPALEIEAQVALILRALAGLTTEEIARSFLVSSETMKRRLTRAKAKIRVAGIPFAIPPDGLLTERLAAVLAAVYLVFNEGYRGRTDLTDEAIHLSRVLARLMPEQPEALGLHALMLFHDARREARFGGDDLVLLKDQDRSLWNAAQIAEGRVILDRARALGGHGAYVLQAMIASLHLEKPADWHVIATLYAQLAELTGSPVVELNHAVAVAHADGAEAALEMVEGLDLDDYLYLHSTRAELLRRLGRTDEARAAYRRAVDLAQAASERRFLERRLADL
ncbi:MAG: sigma-70 family RNA polymerase sigma factor [Candidatus Dormiibacterota bacterium]